MHGVSVITGSASAVSMTAFVLLLAITLMSTTATLSGRITDATGSAMPDVMIDAIDVETGVKWRTVTNDEGLYILTSLPPGMYRLVIQRQGFRTIIKPGLELRVQDIFALNFEMQIGSADSSISQQAGAPLLQAETATLGQTIDSHWLQRLPNITRDPYDFIRLLSGASAAVNFRSPALPSTVTPSRHGLDFAINGQREESVNLLLDGADANSNPVTTRPGQQIPIEAVREYRVLTNGFTSDYGHNSGFVANLVTKSGTNDWHGAVYENFLNSVLAANSFGNNANGIPRPVFNRHQAGASLGGPLISDRTFFFGTFEGLGVRSWGDTGYSGVPTGEILAISSPVTQAVFRQFSGATNLRMISAGTAVSVHPYNTIGLPVSVPFTGTVQPTVPLDKGGGSPQDTYLGIGRVDHAVNERTTLNLRYAYQRTNYLSFPTQQYTEQYTLENDRLPVVRNHNATLSVVRLWSPRVVTESRLTFSRLLARGDLSSYLFNISSARMVRPSATGGPRDLYAFHQSASWLRGHHQLRFGGSTVHYRDTTEVPSGVSFQTTALSLIEGIIDSVTIDFDYLANGFRPAGSTAAPLLDPSRTWHLRYADFAWFLQDTWKVGRRLTVTPGMRWEYFGVQSSVQDERMRDVNFYLGGGRSHSERFANGRFLEAGSAPGHYANHVIRPDRNNFAPRFGVVLDLTGDGKTVLRSSGGVFYDAAFGKIPPSISGTVTFTGVPLTSNLVENPYGIVGRPFRMSAPTVRRVDPDARTAYTTTWNATIEREVAGEAVVSAAYVGSSGSSLEWLAIENFTTSGRYLGRPQERILNEYGDFETITSLGHSSYHSLQIKAETKDIRRLGVRIGANHTWSHSIDNASSRFDRESIGTLMDPVDVRLDRGNSGFDQRHRFVTYFTWLVPKLSIGPGIARRMFRDWEIGGIVSGQTGLPFLVVDMNPSSPTTINTVPRGRPRVTGGLPHVLGPREMVPVAGMPNLFQYLPKIAIRNGQGCIPDAVPFACFESVDATRDLLPRNYYRRPGTMFNDFAVTKYLRFGEHVRLAGRAEFYNMFNHPNLELTIDENSQRAFSTVSALARYGGPPRKVLLAVKVFF